MITNRRHWDQLVADHIRARAGQRSARAALVSLVAVAVVLGLAPAPASAHHFEEPGTKGAQINVTPDGTDAAVEGTSPGLLPTQTVMVEGKGFPASARLELRECTPVACQTIGAAAADATGAFSTQVVVSAYPAVLVPGTPAAPAQGCASQGPNQCRIVAVQLFSTYVNEPSSAAHNICFAPVSGGSDCSTSQGEPTTTTTTAPPQWEPAAPLNAARQGLATAVGADGRVYALGGTQATDFYGAGDALDSAEVFDPCGTRTWSPIAPMPTARTEFAAATGPDGRIYAIGGRDSNHSGTTLASVDAYDPATNTWSTVAPLALPRARLGAATGPDGRIYAIAGKAGNPATSVGRPDGYTVPTVEAYDTATNTWTQVTPLPLDDAELSNLASLGPDNFGAATGPDGRVYSISAGPFGSDDNGVQGTPVPGPVASYAAGSGGMPGVWRKEVAPNTYTQGFSLPAAAAVTTGPDGRIYDIGGLATPRSVLAFDTAADTWSSQETLATRRTRPGAAAGKDGRLYAIGGLDGDSDGLGNPEVLSSTEAVEVAPSSCPSLPPVADFNGDESTDIAVFRPANGVSFFRGQIPEAVAWGAEGDIPVPGDYNGDKQSDLAVFRPPGVWYLRGQTPEAIGWGADGDIPVPADYDGDQKTDVAVFRPSSGTWYIRQSSTGAELAANYGIAGDVPVPADYDGDRNADIAIFRPSTGMWYLQGQSPDAINYGAPDDIPVPADYDGDGDAEIAVFRPSNGVWYLRGQTPDAVAHGAQGDIPVPADYDGDGRADLTVFRPSNGVWYLENGQAIAWGATGDIPLPLPPAIRYAYFGGNP